jgi:hypothetical protein
LCLVFCVLVLSVVGAGSLVLWCSFAVEVC